MIRKSTMVMTFREWENKQVSLYGGIPIVKPFGKSPRSCGLKKSKSYRMPALKDKVYMYLILCHRWYNEFNFVL